MKLGSAIGEMGELSSRDTTGAVGNVLRRATLDLDFVPATGSGRRSPDALSIEAELFVKGAYGAPGRIRTPDPQIRSLVLYPAELPVRTTQPGDGSQPRAQTLVRCPGLGKSDDAEFARPWNAFKKSSLLRSGAVANICVTGRGENFYPGEPEIRQIPGDIDVAHAQ